MTSRREPSLRADARRRYAEHAERERLTTLARGETPLSTSPPQEPALGRAQARPGWGREQAEAGGEALPAGFAARDGASLTARVRALYENSVVPVREIARMAGVTERTLYKYVEKGNWRRRYAVRGVEAAAANRGRRCGPAAGFAPVKGTAGRFIRREDAGKPQARGLKALDPDGACDAAERCDRAATLADDAMIAANAAAEQHRARRQAEKAAQAQMRAFDILAGALIDLARAQAEAGAAWSPRAERVAVRLLAAISRQMARLRGNHGDAVAQV